MSARSTRRTSTVEELLRRLDILRDFTARSSFMRQLFLSYTRLFPMWAMCLPGITYTLYFISVHTSEELYSPFRINIKIHMKLLFIASFAPTVLPISPARPDESYSAFKVRFLSWWQVIWHNSYPCELTIYFFSFSIEFLFIKKEKVKASIDVPQSFEKHKWKFKIFLITNKLKQKKIALNVDVTFQIFVFMACIYAFNLKFFKSILDFFRIFSLQISSMIYIFTKKLKNIRTLQTC